MAMTISNFVERCKKSWSNYRETRFLKKHGCRTREEYNRKYDPDYNIRATRLQDIYHGYPYWHVIKSSSHYCYQLLYDYGPGGYRYGYHDIVDWCDANAKCKYRMDIHRVIKYPSTAYQWEVNELGGSDLIVLAFKDQTDMIAFMLRWG